MKTDEKRMELRVGMFVLAGLAITMISIIVLGGKQSVFTSVNHYRTHFERVDGLVHGAKVTLGGLQVGSVSRISFDSGAREMLVEFSVERDYTTYVRKDSNVEVVTQGVLGDKYLSLNPGDPGQPLIDDLGEVPQGKSKDLSQILSSSDQLMQRLTSTAENLDRILTAFNKGNRADAFFQSLAATSKNMSEVTAKLNDELNQMKLKNTVNHLNSILEKIDQGRGSMGAFINDPALYDDAKALVGQVNRNRIMRNLIRQTIRDNKEKTPESPQDQN
ncbi:MAG: MCE family protein [Proteobacteria bacterium]|nr:MCE family protein [Pseudomonadota bacterium]